MTVKSTVLILGLTGSTGSSIANELLDSQLFNLVGLVRPASVDSKAVRDFKTLGVDIRAVDIESENRASHGRIPGLDDALEGIDIVVSAIFAGKLQLQRPVIDAAKRAGVKRFVPCDFGTACVKGVRKLHDEKLGIQDYIKELELPYTFIDVGYWMDLSLPFNKETAPLPLRYETSRTIYPGNTKSAVIDKRDIGKFVARIISDPRTLNRYVFCWAEEVTQREIIDLVSSATGERLETFEGSGESLKKMLDDSRTNSANWMITAHLEYEYSKWIRGYNTVENAKKVEYGSALDARNIYPDFTPRKLVDYVREIYA